VDIDCGDSERRVGDLEPGSKDNVREDVGKLIGEVTSLKAKKCKKEFKFEHLMILTRIEQEGGNLMSRGVMLMSEQEREVMRVR